MIESKREVKASSKSKRSRDVIAPRKQQSRKSKTTAVSPFSFNEVRDSQHEKFQPVLSFDSIAYFTLRSHDVSTANMKMNQ